MIASLESIPVRREFSAQKTAEGAGPLIAVV